MTWWQQRMCGLDFETTGVDITTDRIVTAAVVHVGGGIAAESLTLLADPGVPIPDGAAKVHGITTERAQAEGKSPGEVLAAVVAALEPVIRAGLPIVGHNVGTFDLSLLARECRRHDVDPPNFAAALVIDTLTIDRFLHRFRSGGRRLEQLCVAYDAALDGAHDAENDALAACRLAYRMGQRGEVVRRVRGRDDAIELNRLKAEWAQVRMSLPQLHAAQMRWALEERRRFAEYKQRHAGELYDAGDAAGAEAELAEANRIRDERGWPVLEPMPHENLETDPLA